MEDVAGGLRDVQPGEHDLHLAVHARTHGGQAALLKDGHPYGDAVGVVGVDGAAGVDPQDIGVAVCGCKGGEGG